MKPKPLDAETVRRTFAALPELARAGVFAGANALYLEHIENPFGRFSMDIDLQNPTEEIEAVHRRFSLQTKKKLVLVSRLSEEIYEYQTRIDRRIVRVEIAKPYLRHRRSYQASRHVAGLEVISLADLMSAKVSALSTRGFARDLIDLFAVDQQRTVDWAKLFRAAARAPDNDYNPTEFHRRLKWHHRECVKPGYAEELPVSTPPDPAVLRQFIDRLLASNRVVAEETLKS